MFRHASVVGDNGRRVPGGDCVVRRTFLTTVLFHFDPRRQIEDLFYAQKLSNLIGRVTMCKRLDVHVLR